MSAVPDFNGVYLLYCTNPAYEGRTYIGYTVNPARRIKQHNLGKDLGGARRTHNKGPWEMVMIIHGFPNSLLALRFEWAWQNPLKTRRLRYKIRRKHSQPQFNYNLQIAEELLQVGPWNRLPLTVQWLEDKFKRVFANLPHHMQCCSGPIEIVQRAQIKYSNRTVTPKCCLCKTLIIGEIALKCLNNNTTAKLQCDLVAHVMCLAKIFLRNQPANYIPIEGECPQCHTNYLWGEWVQFNRTQ